MRRDDLTENLVHLTRGEPQEAADRFRSIYEQVRIVDGQPNRKHGPRICFSEAPVSKIGQILASRDHTFRYQPFGVTVRKTWLFERGGRPIIYQPSSEKAKLGESLRYLHMDFDLRDPKVRDFTWEREWRIPVAELPLDDVAMTLIVPNRAWEAWAREKRSGQIQVSLMLTGGLGGPEMTRFKWYFLVLEDLGIELGNVPAPPEIG